MIIFLYTAVLLAGMYWVSKNLLPELLKPSSPKNNPQPVPSDFSEFDEPVNREEKLEGFLYEKNRNIELLQKELRVLYVQVRDYDKIKTLLEDEIHRLKEQNRIFRSELGMPAVQPKENLFI